jgi:hypothetical protein
MYILARIKALSRKVKRKSETYTTLLELLEGSLCRMVDTLSRKDFSDYWNPPRNSDSDDI